MAMIPIRDVLITVVSQLHVQFTHIVNNVLKNIPDEAQRRTELINYFENSRIVLARLLALVRWASVAIPIHTSLGEVQRTTDEYHRLYDAIITTVDTISQRALADRSRPWDVHGALKTIYGGSYQGLPRVLTGDYPIVVPRNIRRVAHEQIHHFITATLSSLPIVYMKSIGIRFYVCYGALFIAVMNQFCVALVPQMLPLENPFEHQSIGHDMKRIRWHVLDILFLISSSPQTASKIHKAANVPSYVTTTIKTTKMSHITHRADNPTLSSSIYGIAPDSPLAHIILALDTAPVEQVALTPLTSHAKPVLNLRERINERFIKLEPTLIASSAPPAKGGGGVQRQPNNDNTLAKHPINIIISLLSNFLHSFMMDLFFDQIQRTSTPLPSSASARVASQISSTMAHHTTLIHRKDYQYYRHHRLNIFYRGAPPHASPTSPSIPRASSAAAATQPHAPHILNGITPIGIQGHYQTGTNANPILSLSISQKSYFGVTLSFLRVDHSPTLSPDASNYKTTPHHNADNTTAANHLNPPPPQQLKDHEKEQPHTYLSSSDSRQLKALLGSTSAQLHLLNILHFTELVSLITSRKALHQLQKNLNTALYSHTDARYHLSKGIVMPLRPSAAVDYNPVPAASSPGATNSGRENSQSGHLSPDTFAPLTLLIPTHQAPSLQTPPVLKITKYNPSFFIDPTFGLFSISIHNKLLVYPPLLDQENNGSLQSQQQQAQRHRQSHQTSTQSTGWSPSEPTNNSIPLHDESSGGNVYIPPDVNIDEKMQQFTQTLRDLPQLSDIIKCGVFITPGVLPNVENYIFAYDPVYFDAGRRDTKHMLPTGAWDNLTHHPVQQRNDDEWIIQQLLGLDRVTPRTDNPSQDQHLTGQRDVINCTYSTFPIDTSVFCTLPEFLAGSFGSSPINTPNAIQTSDAPPNIQTLSTAQEQPTQQLLPPSQYCKLLHTISQQTPCYIPSPPFNVSGSAGSSLSRQPTDPSNHAQITPVFLRLNQSLYSHSTAKGVLSGFLSTVIPHTVGELYYHALTTPSSTFIVPLCTSILILAEWLATIHQTSMLANIRLEIPTWTFYAPCGQLLSAPPTPYLDIGDDSDPNSAVNISSFDWMPYALYTAPDLTSTSASTQTRNDTPSKHLNTTLDPLFSDFTIAIPLKTANMYLVISLTHVHPLFADSQYYEDFLTHTYPYYIVMVSPDNPDTVVYVAPLTPWVRHLAGQGDDATDATSSNPSASSDDMASMQDASTSVVPPGASETDVLPDLCSKMLPTLSQLTWNVSSLQGLCTTAETVGNLLSSAFAMVEFWRATGMPYTPQILDFTPATFSLQLHHRELLLHQYDVIARPVATPPSQQQQAQPTGADPTHTHMEQRIECIDILPNITLVYSPSSPPTAATAVPWSITLSCSNAAPLVTLFAMLDGVTQHNTTPPAPVPSYTWECPVTMIPGIPSEALAALSPFTSIKGQFQNNQLDLSATGMAPTSPAMVSAYLLSFYLLVLHYFRQSNFIHSLFAFNIYTAIHHSMFSPDPRICYQPGMVLPVSASTNGVVIKVTPLPFLRLYPSYAENFTPSPNVVIDDDLMSFVIASTVNSTAITHILPVYLYESSVPRDKAALYAKSVWDQRSHSIHSIMETFVHIAASIAHQDVFYHLEFTSDNDRLTVPPINYQSIGVQPTHLTKEHDVSAKLSLLSSAITPSNHRFTITSSIPIPEQLLTSIADIPHYYSGNHVSINWPDISTFLFPPLHHNVPFTLHGGRSTITDCIAPLEVAYIALRFASIIDVIPQLYVFNHILEYSQMQSRLVRQASHKDQRGVVVLRPVDYTISPMLQTSFTLTLTAPAPLGPAHSTMFLIQPHRFTVKHYYAHGGVIELYQKEFSIQYLCNVLTLFIRDTSTRNAVEPSIATLPKHHPSLIAPYLPHVEAYSKYFLYRLASSQLLVTTFRNLFTDPSPAAKVLGGMLQVEISQDQSIKFQIEQVESLLQKTPQQQQQQQQQPPPRQVKTLFQIDFTKVHSIPNGYDDSAKMLFFTVNLRSVIRAPFPAQTSSGTEQQTSPKNQGSPQQQQQQQQFMSSKSGASVTLSMAYSADKNRLYVIELLPLTPKAASEAAAQTLQAYTSRGPRSHHHMNLQHVIARFNRADLHGLTTNLFDKRLLGLYSSRKETINGKPDLSQLTPIQGIYRGIDVFDALRPAVGDKHPRFNLALFFSWLSNVDLSYFVKLLMNAQVVPNIYRHQES